VQLYI